jgi:hypothetical protein
MPARSSNETSEKAALSVSDMARRCGLSRSHFNLLIRTGIMPQPLYSLRNRRPFYDQEFQELCLRVRSTNTGADGQYVVFYDRRSVSPPTNTAPSRTRTTRQQPTAQTDAHAELVDGLRALGLTDATAAQVDAALRACYPSGHAGIDEGEVLRELWRHLRRQNGD